MNIYCPLTKLDTDFTHICLFKGGGVGIETPQTETPTDRDAPLDGDPL